MTLVGCTINPLIGFIMPVVFYWTIIKDKSIYSFDKILGIFTILFIMIVSTISLISFFS